VKLLCQEISWIISWICYDGSTATAHPSRAVSPSLQVCPCSWGPWLQRTQPCITVQDTKWDINMLAGTLRTTRGHPGHTEHKANPGVGALRCLNVFPWVCVFYQTISLLRPPGRATVEKFQSQTVRYASLPVWHILSQNMLHDNIC
jgi:hypothetical protein